MVIPFGIFLFILRCFSHLKTAIPEREFETFALIWNIAVEAPVPNSPIVGQRETLIPFVAMPNFEEIALYT
jgi:hypothetical protein